MSFESIRQAIESRFNTEWGSTTPIKWSNIEFKYTPKQDFVVFHIIDFSTQRAEITINNPLHRHTGIIAINIYSKNNTGMNTVNEYIDAALDVFRDVTFSGITCFGHEVQKLGERNGWYIASVNFNFRADFRYSPLTDPGIVFEDTSGVIWTDTSGNEWEDRA